MRQTPSMNKQEKELIESALESGENNSLQTGDRVRRTMEQANNFHKSDLSALIANERGGKMGNYVDNSAGDGHKSFAPNRNPLSGIKRDKSLEELLTIYDQDPTKLDKDELDKVVGWFVTEHDKAKQMFHDAAKQDGFSEEEIEKEWNSRMSNYLFMKAIYLILCTLLCSVSIVAKDNKNGNPSKEELEKAELLHQKYIKAEVIKSSYETKKDIKSNGTKRTEKERVNRHDRKEVRILLLLF